MKKPNIKTRNGASLPEGYDCRDCGGGDVCCDCCMANRLHGYLPNGESQPQRIEDFLAQAVDVLETLADALRDDRPFNEADLIEAIEENAVAVCYGERLLVWVPHCNMVDFMHPLLTEVLEGEQLSVLMDEGLALFDLTDICEANSVDMIAVYCHTEL